MLETDIQKAIMKYLKAKGYMVWKNLTEGARTGGRGRGKNPNKGIPDICAVKDGVTHYIEIKRPEGKLSEHQIKWHQEAYRHGVIVHVVTSLDQIKEIF